MGGESQLISIYDSGSFHIPIIDIRKNLHYGIVLHISYTVDWEATSNVHMSTGGTCFSALREDGKINVKELDTEKYEGGTAATSPGDPWSGGKETHRKYGQKWRLHPSGKVIITSEQKIYVIFW